MTGRMVATDSFIRRHRKRHGLEVSGMAAMAGEAEAAKTDMQDLASNAGVPFQRAAL